MLAYVIFNKLFFFVGSKFEAEDLFKFNMIKTFVRTTLIVIYDWTFPTLLFASKGYLENRGNIFTIVVKSVSWIFLMQISILATIFFWYIFFDMIFISEIFQKFDMIANPHFVTLFLLTSGYSNFCSSLYKSFCLTKITVGERMPRIPVHLKSIILRSNKI